MNHFDANKRKEKNTQLRIESKMLLAMLLLLERRQSIARATSVTK
jgi:hypothetical protein